MCFFNELLNIVKYNFKVKTMYNKNSTVCESDPEFTQGQENCDAEDITTNHSRIINNVLWKFGGEKNAVLLKVYKKREPEGGKRKNIQKE